MKKLLIVICLLVSLVGCGGQNSASPTTGDTATTEGALPIQEAAPTQKADTATEQEETPVEAEAANGSEPSGLAIVDDMSGFSGRVLLASPAQLVVWDLARGEAIFSRAIDNENEQVVIGQAGLSPNGRYLVYVELDMMYMLSGLSHIHRVELDSGDTVVTPSNVGEQQLSAMRPSVSDEGLVAFSQTLITRDENDFPTDQSDTIAIWDGSSDPRALTPPEMGNAQPYLSRDGQTLLFLSDVGGEGNDFYRVATDGSSDPEAVGIAQAPEINEIRAELPGSLSVAHDGSRIAFIASLTDDGQGIAVYDTTDRSVTLLGQATEPGRGLLARLAMSGDGQTVVMSAMNPQDPMSRPIIRFDLDSPSSGQEIASGGQFASLQLSPDGRTVLATKQDFTADETFALLVMKNDGSDRRTITHDDDLLAMIAMGIGGILEFAGQ